MSIVFDKTRKLLNNLKQDASSFVQYTLPQKLNQFASGPGVRIANAVQQLPRLAQEQWGNAGLITQHPLLSQIPQNIQKPITTAIRLGPAPYMTGWANAVASATPGSKLNPLQRASNIAAGVYQTTNPFKTMMGGALGVPINYATNAAGNLWKGQPINQGFDPVAAYQQGFDFQSKLGPAEAVTSPVTSPILNTIFKGKGVIPQITKAGFEAGIPMGFLGATEDAKNGRERLKNVLTQFGQGFAFGAGTKATGIGYTKVKNLFNPTETVTAQLRDSAGRWTAGDKLVKPPKMPQDQWEFQIAFNEKYKRNPYTPVYPSDLQKAIKYEADKRIGLQVRDVNKDLNPLDTPKKDLVDMNASNKSLYDTYGTVKEWGTRNQYVADNPYRSQLDQMKKTGNFDAKVIQKADRWDLQQVLKDKPAFLNDGNLPVTELTNFAKEHNLYFGQLNDGRNTSVVAKNKATFDAVANANNQRELGLALGYQDLGKPPKELKQVFNVPQGGIGDISKFKAEYPDSTNNPLYENMMKVRHEIFSKTDQIPKNIKSDADIPKKLLSELNDLKVKHEQAAKAWQDVYVNKNTPQGGLSELQSIEFPSGLYQAFKKMSPTEFLDYAKKNKDYYIPSEEKQLLESIKGGQGAGLLSADQLPKKIRLKNAGGGGDIKLTPEQADYFLNAPTQVKGVSELQSKVPGMGDTKIPINEKKVNGEYGSFNPNSGKIQVGNLMDNTTIIHEVTHKKYEALPKEAQGSLDYALKQLSDKNYGIFTTTMKPEENIAHAAEEYLLMKNKYGSRFTDEFGKIVGGRELARFLKDVNDEAANNIKKIPKVPGMGVAETKPVEGFKTPGELLDHKLPQLDQQTATNTEIPAPKAQESQIPQGGGQQVPPGSSSSQGSIAQDPVQKVIALLNEAKPVRGQQEALYSAERARRTATIANIGKSTQGEAGFYKQLGALKGELPKVQFERIRNGLHQTDIDSLFNKVEGANISPFEKITAKTGLSKLLGAEGGTVPNESEIKLLSEIFPPEFIQAIQAKRPFMQRLWGGIQGALNLPRAIMATADLSAPLRQGIFLVGRPKQWIPAFRDMFKYALSDKAYQGLLEDIKARPNYQLMRESKLALTDMSPVLSSREEAFMSNLPEKIPLFGNIAKGSNRAYSGFLTKLRADTFDSLVNTAKEQGIDVKGKTLEDIASFVNSATGRGNLGRTMQKAAPILNGVFFSPRLMASRINLLNPVTYIKYDPFVRKEALKSLLGFATTAGTVLGLASLGGAQVGTDPRSADFGKIKVGNTRYDILGGFQQYIKLAAQLLSGQVVSSTTGKVITLGEGYKPLTRKDILVRFFEAKEAPVASFITDLITGQTGVGEPVNIPTEVINRFIPLMAQDIYDLSKDRGSIGQGLMMALPGIFGAGSQTYGKSEFVQGENKVGQPTSQIRPVPGLAETLSEKAFGQQPLGSSSTYNIQTFVTEMRKLPRDQQVAQWNQIVKTNPELAKKIKQVLSDEKKGITVQDQTLKQMGVASGDRATAIYKQINKLKTKEEKTKLWNDYVKKGIITPEIAKQLKLLFSK